MRTTLDGTIPYTLGSYIRMIASLALCTTTHRFASVVHYLNIYLVLKLFLFNAFYWVSVISMIHILFLVCLYPAAFNSTHYSVRILLHLHTMKLKQSSNGIALKTNKCMKLPFNTIRITSSINHFKIIV